MLPFFYHKDLNASSKQIILNEETSKHCVQVLRMQKLEQLKLTNGLGLEMLVEIIEPNKKNTIVNVVEAQQNEASEKKVTIAIGLLKNTSRLEWFLEKAAELGVYKVIPLQTKRTERENFKFDRLNNILVAAMLQSQQIFLTILEQPQTLEQLFTNHQFENKLIAHCIDAEKKSIQNSSNNTIILIGPEGDFTEDEINLALANNYQPVTLGNTRLRTETAGVAAASLLMIETTN